MSEGTPIEFTIKAGPGHEAAWIGLRPNNPADARVFLEALVPGSTEGVNLAEAVARVSKAFQTYYGGAPAPAAPQAPVAAAPAAVQAPANDPWATTPAAPAAAPTAAPNPWDAGPAQAAAPAQPAAKPGQVPPPGPPPIGDVSNMPMVWRSGIAGPNAKNPGAPYAFWADPRNLPRGTARELQDKPVNG